MARITTFEEIFGREVSPEEYSKLLNGLVRAMVNKKPFTISVEEWK